MSADEIELSRIFRDAEEKARQGQHGEAFIDLAKEIAAGKVPLLTSIVPSGMDNRIDRKPPAPRPSIRKVR